MSKGSPGSRHRGAALETSQKSHVGAELCMIQADPEMSPESLHSTYRQTKSLAATTYTTRITEQLPHVFCLWGQDRLAKVRSRYIPIALSGQVVKVPFFQRF